MFEIIQENLKKTQDSANFDKSAFEDWIAHRISIEECRERFFKNNEINSLQIRSAITINLFLMWLRSLGW